MRGFRKMLRIKPALHYALWLPISILGVACVSTEKAPIVLSAPPKKSQIILEAGPLEKKPDPMPDYIPIYVKTLLGEELLSRDLGYNGWDFDKDGRFDMLEELDAKGQVLRRAYDWDHDGQIDEVQSSEEKKQH